MQEEDYTFVTLDSDDAILTDAVIVGVDGEKRLVGCCNDWRKYWCFWFYYIIRWHYYVVRRRYAGYIFNRYWRIWYIVHFMISVKCPHCHVGLKVDEGKIPLDITSFKMPEVQTTDSSLFAIYGERKCRIWIGNGSDTAFSYDDRTSLCNYKCWYAGANFPSSGRCLYHRTKNPRHLLLRSVLWRLINQWAENISGSR